jgi:hypothetical protein
MKKDHLWMLVALFVMAFFLFFFEKVSNFQNTVTIPRDSIFVYGNVHLLPANLVPLAEQTERDDVVFVQAELYNDISQEVVLMESLPFTGERYQAEELYLEAGAITDAEKQRVDNYANLYDTGLRFIIEGKKFVYGAENAELFQASMDSLETDINFALSEGFSELNDLRSEKIAQNATTICRSTKQKVAVIVGTNHLPWFLSHGYQVKYSPKY